MRWLVAVIVLLTLAPLQHAVAAPVGLAITKNLFDVTLPPGGTYEGTVTVMNWSDIEVPVRIELTPWDVGVAEDQITFGDEGGASDATGWFAVKTKEFKLAPHGERTVSFTATTPTDTLPGSYLVMMRFIPELPENSFEADGPRFIPELGALFFIGVSTMTLEGERASYDGRVAAFTPQGAGRLTLLERFTPGAAAGIYDELVRKFQVVLENRGLYHFQTKGTVVVTNLFGLPVARFELPSRYLLPGRVRTLPVAAASETSWWERYGHMGRYTAHLTLSVPGHELPVVTEASFWVFPWQLLLPLGAAAGFVILLHARLLAAAHAFIRGSAANRAVRRKGVKKS